MSRTLKIIISVLLAAVLGIAAYFIITSQIKNSKHVDTSEFLEMVESGDFKEIEVDGYTLKGYFRDKNDYR